LTLLNIRVLTEQLGGIGVSGFVVLSGFGLTYARLSVRSRLNVGSFWRQRMIRITPLYYVALAAWLFAVALVPPANLLAHLLFVHVFFQDFSHNPGSLWYIGLIVQCYLVFPPLILMLQHGRIYLVWALALLAYVLGIALISAGVYLSDTVLMFGLEFVLGMDLAARMTINQRNPYLSRVGWGVGAFALMAFAVAYQALGWSELSHWITWPLTTFGRLGFFLVTLNIAARINTPRLAKAAVPLAFASYAVYLFHRPFWTLAVQSPLWGWIGRLPPVLVNPMQFTYLVLVGIPLIFFVSYWIQSANDRTIVVLHSQR